MEERNKHEILGDNAPAIPGTSAAPSVGDIEQAAVRLRAAIEHDLSVEGAAAIADSCLRTTNNLYKPANDVIAAIADRLGWSCDSLAISMAAAFAPLAQKEALESFARTLRPRRAIVGFVMAGNVPGAGLHEVIAALLAGCAVMVKTATAEPIFFAAFAAALRAIDQLVGARIAVFNWPRERDDLTTAMREACDIFVAFGDDGTIARLQSPIAGSNQAPFAGFGARVSGIALTRGSLDEITIRKSAEDVAMFEQRGCLSPHHIFTEDLANSDSHHVAIRFAEELRHIARRMPPPHRLSLEDAAAIRRARDIARWRSIGGDGVALWEGARLDWTLVHDRDANFTVSPGFRTVYISPFSDLTDLKRRLEPARGRIEAFAIAGEADHGEIDRLLREFGASHVCEPGRMQSPPPDWPHGGGAFLRLLRDDK